MKITSRGQVTIPQDIRQRFGFLPHCPRLAAHHRGSPKGGMTTRDASRYRTYFPAVESIAPDA